MTSVKITKKAKKERTIKQDLAVFKTKNSCVFELSTIHLGLCSGREHRKKMHVLEEISVI